MKIQLHATFLALLLASCAQAENIVYPVDAGVLNVKTEFGAKGDGKTDDTAAIQKALSAAVSKHKIVYLPDGIYRVSDTLKWNSLVPNAPNGGWAPFAQLQGQSRAKTIIQLADQTAGFTDAALPKAIIQTGSSAGHGNKKYANGEGNEAFENHIRNLSVDAGQNAGAVGIDYQVSNCGAMRDVSIKGNGVTGLRLERRDNGPGLLKNVSVEGFASGIRARQDIVQMTLENISLSNQTEVGLSMDGSIFAVRKLTSRNSVPAIKVAGSALLVLLDSEFSGGAPTVNAIESGDKARFYLRNIKAAGYGGALKRGEKIEKGPISELATEVLGQSGTPLSLGLPVKETPEFWDADLKNWASVGAPNKNDDTKAIQAAMNSGKSTVYFPGDGYKITDTISVPPSVRLVLGLGTGIGVKTSDKKKPMADDKPMFRFEGGSNTDTTMFDRFTFSASQGRVFDHAGPRTVVLRDLITFSTRGVYRSQVRAGPLFIEDIAGTNYEFAPGTLVWARQLNIEGNANPRVWNRGAKVWALGWKTEGEAIVARNEGGGSLEMLGGLTYTFGMKPEVAAFENKDSDLATSFGGTTYAGPKGFYRSLVRETRGETVRELSKKAAPGRGGGVSVALYVSRKDGDLTKIAALTEPGAIVQTVADEKPAEKTSDKPKTDKPKKEAAPAPGITLENAVTKDGGATIFRMPDSWRGTEVDAATNNPLVLNGKPTWRLDTLLADEADKWDSFAPLTWSGKKWRAPENTFGRPEAQISNGVVRPTVRGPWTGQPGRKRAALVFIAPQTGKYTLEGSALIDFFNGNTAKPMKLDFIKLDPTAKTATPLSSVELTHQTAAPLKVEVELSAGQELALVPQIAARNTAANVKLGDLKVTLAGR